MRARALTTLDARMRSNMNVKAHSKVPSSSSCCMYVWGNRMASKNEMSTEKERERERERERESGQYDVGVCRCGCPSVGSGGVTLPSPPTLQPETKNEKQKMR